MASIMSFHRGSWGSGSTCQRTAPLSLSNEQHPCHFLLPPSAQVLHTYARLSLCTVFCIRAYNPLASFSACSLSSFSFSSRPQHSSSKHMHTCASPC
jgi:hypothetical protein